MPGIGHDSDFDTATERTDKGSGQMDDQIVSKDSVSIMNWPPLQDGVAMSKVEHQDYVAEFNSWDPDVVHFMSLGGCGRIGMNLYVYAYKVGIPYHAHVVYASTHACVKKIV